MSARTLPPRLLALSPGGGAALSERFLARLRAACEAGLRGLLLREPELGDAAFLELARAVRRELDRWPGSWLALHDRPHLAGAAGAQAVHLGGRSLPAREVRAWLAPDCALGFSSHAGDPEGRCEGCDYLILAPYGEVPRKGPALGAAGLRRELARSRLPLWALGGIAPADAPGALAAGARGVAVQRGVFGALDCAAAVRAFLAALEASAPGSAAPGGRLDSMSP